MRVMGTNVQIGKQYASRQKPYLGRIVLVLKLTTAQVRFRVVHGPGKSLGKEEWMGLETFSIAYLAKDSSM